MATSDLPQFRFGVVFTGEQDRDGWPELARRVEGHGFSTLLVADHLLNPMASIPLITAAATTTTLRVVSFSIRRARDRWGITYWVCSDRSLDAIVAMGVRPPVGRGGTVDRAEGP